MLSGNSTLENTGTDITTVFGANSPEEQEAKSNAAKAQAEFNNQSPDPAQAQQLIDQGNALLQQVSTLAGGS